MASVALFLRPEIQGQGGQVVHGRDRMAVAGHVNTLDVRLAGVAGVDARLRELFCAEYGQLVFVLLSTVGAENAPEFPLAGTQATNEGTFRAVVVLPQNR